VWEEPSSDKGFKIQTNPATFFTGEKTSLDQCGSTLSDKKKGTKEKKVKATEKERTFI